jgi:aerobic-type carbon monoxide dehydrogenase small subunit (CoxS/CutS family)
MTIEGLARNGDLHPIQAAFMEANALQCGFCTSGMILKTYGLLKKIPQPSTTQIIEEMEGNLCRCGNYGRIIEAIQRVSRSLLGEKQ